MNLLKLTPSQEETVRHQFDSFCKKILREEARNYAKHIAWRSEHEISLSSLSEEEQNRLYVLDEYPSEQFPFRVQEHNILIHDEKLADALNKLSSEKRSIVLLAYALGMTDQRIADELGMVRYTVQRRRAQTLKELKKELEKTGW